MSKYTVRALNYENKSEEDFVEYRSTNWWIVAIFDFIVLGVKYDYVDMQKRK